MSLFKKIMWGWSSKDDQPTSTAQEEHKVENVEPKKTNEPSKSLYLDCLVNKPFLKHKVTGEILFTNFSCGYYDTYTVTKLSNYEELLIASVKEALGRTIVSYSVGSSAFNIDDYDVYTTRKQIIDLYYSIDDDTQLNNIKYFITNCYLQQSQHHKIFENLYKSYAKVTDRFYVNRDLNADRHSKHYYNLEESFDYVYYDLLTGEYDVNINNMIFKLFLLDTDIQTLIDNNEVEIFVESTEFKDITSEIYVKHKLEQLVRDEKYYNECIEVVLKEHYKINIYLENKGLPKLLPVSDLQSFMQFIEVMKTYDFVPDVKLYDYDNFNENADLKYAISRYFNNIKEI